MRSNEARLLVSMGVLLASMPVHADPAPPPGFVEPIVQWGVQKGETCEDIAKALYGSATHVPLIGRYNRVVCAAGQPLPEGTTLILPKSVTSVPDARVKSSHPDVRGRPSGGSWATVTSGASLYRNHNVQTMDQGRAHIEFLDHTHVFLAQNTLIVVYGTASKTRVSKTPPTVELQAGEVQAGLSALRGEPAVVAVPGGGQISAASRDTVVERKAARTTVAVFEGRCAVESGGKTVTVPKHFGTRFEGAAPPAPPRPLPPAPHWNPGGSPSIVLAPPGTAVIATSWTAVDKAKAYRLEVSRDEPFHDLVVREEVPATVLSFRAERLPPGTYHVRVRAIDTEEYLGIASDVRTIEVVAAEVRGEGSSLGDGKIVANPYGVLSLATQKGLEVSLDDGPFGTIPDEVDLVRQTPQNLRIRTASGKIERIVVEYTRVGAEPSASFDEAKRTLTINVKLTGAQDIDVMRRISPQLRARVGGRVETVPLTAQQDKTLIGTVDMGDRSGEVRFDITDGKGRLLGSNSALIPEKPAPAKPKRRPAKQIGLVMPPMRPVGVTGLPWSSPTAPLAAGIGVGEGLTPNGRVIQGNLRASGSLGPVGLEALVQSPPFEEDYPASADYPPTENMAWLGVRYRAYRRGESALEIAPVLRVGLPLVWHGQALRLDLGGAIGGVSGRWTWLVNAGAQLALGSENELIPTIRPYAVAGGTFDLLDWFRAYAAADVHLLASVGGSYVVPYGLSGGFEVGRSFFASVSGWVGRAESVEPQIAFTGTLSVGFHLNEARP